MNKDYNKEYYNTHKEEYKKRAKKYYQKNKKKVKAYVKDYQQKNKDRDREKRTALRHRWTQNNPERYLFLSARNSAKFKGIVFSIDVSDIIIPELCPILGIKLTNIQGKGRVGSNISIDRIDSSKGYVKGNVQVLSDLANRMKQNATKEELLAFASGIVKYYRDI